MKFLLFLCLNLRIYKNIYYFYFYFFLYYLFVVSQSSKLIESETRPSPKLDTSPLAVTFIVIIIIIVVVGKYEAH